MNELKHKLLAFIEDNHVNDDLFNQLSIELFKYQSENNEHLLTYYENKDIDVNKIQTWKDIPAIPVQTFKKFRLSAVSKEDIMYVFFSSGTTSQNRSFHYLDDFSVLLYSRASILSFKKYVLPDHARLPIYSLVIPFEEVPHSSLAFMICQLKKHFSDLEHKCYIKESKYLISELKDDLSKLKEPIILFGTTLSFLLLMDQCPENFHLPEGSRIVETGGLKSSSQTVEKSDFYSKLHNYFNVPQSHIISEYGMTELLSQYYDNTLYNYVNKIKSKSYKSFEPWLKTQIIDPITGNECKDGEKGVLVHCDLLNYNSAIKIHTEDVGYKINDGIELTGRAVKSEPRGCSLNYENIECI